MEKVADTVTPQPVCAIVGALDVSLESLVHERADEGGRLLLVCVDVRDPGNLGALMRSGAASGAAGVVTCAGCVDPYSPKTVRASAGAVFSLPLVRGGEALGVLAQLRRVGYVVWGTEARGGKDYLEADLSGDVALVLGNEATGLPDDLSMQLDGQLTIPMAAAAESLNVAMAGAVLCFEAAKQRRAPAVAPIHSAEDPSLAGT